jgi:hypothetical protein
VTPPRPGTGVGEVWLGYTLADLRAIADRAAAYCRWGDRFAFAERADIAWAGIIDHLTTCPTPPQPFEVYQAAQRAIGAAAATELREHGHRHGPNGLYATPRFEAYWAPRPAPGADAVVVDRMALWQIWATLRPVHKLVFLALAAHNDYTKAAHAAGYPTSTFNALICQARAEFLTHWHQGEQPSHIWATDRHGHTDIQHRVRRTITAKRKRASAGELPAAGHPAGRLPGR